MLVSDWAKCPKSRAALTIYLHRNKECPHPYDCRFWDGLRERCTIRLASDTLAVEVVLNRLKRLDLTDSMIASSLGVSKSVVSRWRSGKAPITEERMAELESLLRNLREQASIEEDAIESQIYFKADMARYVRSVLNFLNKHGYNDAGVAWYLGVSKSAVSKWRRGETVPCNDRLKAMEELEEELAAEEEKWKKRWEKLTNVSD